MTPQLGSVVDHRRTRQRAALERPPRRRGRAARTRAGEQGEPVGRQGEPLYGASLGPDGVGRRSSETLDVTLPAGDYDDVGAPAWVGDEPKDCYGRGHSDRLRARARLAAAGTTAAGGRLGDVRAAAAHPDSPEGAQPAADVPSRSMALHVSGSSRDSRPGCWRSGRSRRTGTAASTDVSPWSSDTRSPTCASSRARPPARPSAPRPLRTGRSGPSWPSRLRNEGLSDRQARART